MPEDATRKLLKLFGIALTNFEDVTKTTLDRAQALASGSEPPAAALALVEQWLKADDEAVARWLEVTQWFVETHAKGRAGLLQAIRAAPRSLE